MDINDRFADAQDIILKIAEVKKTEAGLVGKVFEVFALSTYQVERLQTGITPQ